MRQDTSKCINSCLCLCKLSNVDRPLGFDELTGIYDHYTVIGSKIKVTMHNLDAAETNYVAVTLSDDAGSITNFQNLLENGRTRFKTLCPDTMDKGFTSIALGFSAAKFFGRPRGLTLLNDDLLKGSNAANPVEQAYYVIVVQPRDGGDNAVVRCLVEIEYIAVWTEPHRLASS